MASTSSSSSGTSGGSGSGGGVLGAKRKVDEVFELSSTQVDEAKDPIDNEAYVEKVFGLDDKKRNKAALIFEILDEVCNKSAADSFACGGPFPTPIQTPPTISIEGFGDVSFPLKENDAQEIIKLCDRSPFGRGEETVLDVAVRNSWQLGPEKVKFKEAEAWTQALTTLVNDKIVASLGLDAYPIAAHFYKLLFYEPGSFFKPHKDTEKELGMFGSLIITLPGEFEGGELVVIHEKSKTKKTFTSQSTTDNDTKTKTMSYAAFFADCLHELLPVTKGYRVALAYNLVTVGQGPLPEPQDAFTVRRIARSLRKWRETNAKPEKLIVVLEHEYTVPSMNLRGMKGPDRTMTKLLKAAVANEGDHYDLSLASIEFWQNGPADRPYGCRTWSLDEPYLQQFTIKRMFDLNGKKRNVDIALYPNEVYPEDYFMEAEDFKHKVNVHTGNEGAKIDMWYRCAILIVSPKGSFVPLDANKPANVQLTAYQYKYFK